MRPGARLEPGRWLVLVVVTVALVMAGFRLVGRDFMLRRTAT